MDTLAPKITIAGRPRALHKQALAERRSKAATIAILAILMALAAVISLLFLRNQSLRLDEAQSLWQSSHSIRGVLDTIAKDVHVPLYGLMLHFWMLFFGNDVAVTRLLSLFFFLLAIPVSYAVAARTLNRKMGLFVALLVALSPFFNWYGSETRMYSMLAFFALANQYFFVRIFQFKRHQGTLEKPSDTLAALWWGYGLTALLGVYTHYFFWFALFTQAAFFFMYRKSFPPKTLARFTLTAVLLALAVSPWFYHVRQVNEISNATPVLIRPTSVDLFNTFSQFLFGFQNDHINTVLVSLWPLSVLFGFLSLRRRQNIPPEIVYFFLAAILPITFAFVVSTFVRPIFLSRYLILAAPSLYIFFTWVLSNYPKALSVSLRFALVAIMIVTLAQQTLAASTPVKEDYRDVSEYVAGHATAQDVVALSAPFTVYPFEYYYKGVAPMVTLPLWNRFQSGSIPVYSAEAFPNDVSAATANHDNVWLVLSYDQGFQRDVYLYFETHYERLLHIQFSPNLDLYKYKIRYDGNSPQIQNP